MKYKTFEELKEELGDKFEEYMYKTNIELLTKIDKAIEYINKNVLVGFNKVGFKSDIVAGIVVNELLEILGGKE